MESDLPWMTSSRRWFRNGTAHQWSLFVLSFLLACLAQYLFTGEVFTRFRIPENYPWKNDRILPIVITILSVFVAVLATWKKGFWEAPVAPAKTLPEGSLRDVVPGAAALLVLLVLFFVTGETALVHWVWVLAALCLLLPFYRRERPVFVAADVDAWEWVLVGAATVLAFLFRYWRLTEFPSHIDNDVALMGLRTLEMLDADDARWTGLAYSGHLRATHQILGGSMRLFGPSQQGVVMFSVLAGTLTVPLIFLLGRLLYGRVAGLIAMAFLVGSYVHVHFSRIMFGPTATLFLFGSLYFLFRGFRENRAFWAGLSGLALGFGLLTYYSARIGPILFGLIFLVWLVREPVSRAFKCRFTATFALGAMIGLGPVLGFALQKPKEFSGRTRDVILWSPEVMRHSMAKYQTDSVKTVVLEQVKRTFLTNLYFGDESPHFAMRRPFVGGFAAVLFLVGLGMLLARFLTPENTALLGVFFLTFILGGVLTYDPPYWPHLNIALPAIYLICAVAASKLLEFVSSLIPGNHPAVFAVAAGVFVFLAGHHWSVYLETVADDARARTRASRFLRSLPAEARVYMFSSDSKSKAELFRFFNAKLKITEAEPSMLDALPSPNIQPLCFILFEKRELVETIVKKYPSGHYREHPPGQAAQFLSYTVGIPDSEFIPGYARELPFLARSGWWILIGGLTSIAFFYFRRYFVQDTGESGGMGAAS